MSGTRERFTKDLFFIAVSKYSGMLVSIIISMVLARILSPSDYGVVAIATVFIVFFSLFTDMGLGTAVIHNKELTYDDYAHIFGWSFWIGLVLSALFALAAIPISNFYDQEVLVPICQLLSLQLLFSSLNIVPNALLSKNKCFKTIAIRNLIIQVSCGVISILFASFGGGLYSLLINPIAGAILLFIANQLHLKQGIHFIPSAAPLKKIFSYSLYQFLAQIVGYFGNNISSLIIGKTISVSALGFYQKAQQTIGMPSSAINGVVTPVLFPYLSDWQNDLPRMYNAFERVNRFVITLAFPIAALLLVCSREIILIFYGPQWGDSINCFAIMTFIIAMQISSVCTTAVFQACGCTDVLFRLGLVNTSVSIICLTIGAIVIRTIEGVAWMGTISSAISAVLSIAVVYSRCFNESFMPLFKYSLGPILYFVLFISFFLLLDKSISLNIFFSLFIKLFAWFATLLIYLHFFTTYDIRYLISQIRNRIGLFYK